MKQKRYIAYFGVGISLVTIFFIISALSSSGDGTLRVSFLRAGEGRAIFVHTPSGASILIDGGKDSETLRALAKELGPLQRTISMIIETNTEASNSGGIYEVLDRYQVGALVTAGMPNKSVGSRLVARIAGKIKYMVHFEASRGTRILFPKGTQIDVLFPDRDVSGTNADTGSLVLRITYGDTSFLLPSDAPVGVQRWLTKLDASTTLASNVLSIGHFGAEKSLDKKWLQAVHPQFVVISAGENSYGYPDVGTVKDARAEGARVFTTASSTITFVSDGIHVRVLNTQ
ncbi:MAG TPA: hypothetical protein ENJ75_02265 [Candidatus Kaiserbacteria bacterium]|nr:hypothetical protein [Candidatus Kaiserbacteria bacterium]